MLSLSSLNPHRLSISRGLSTVAATIASAESSSLPSHILHAAAPTVSTMGNGVTVCSLFECSDNNSVPQHVTVRIKGVGSRHDSVGGESALLAATLSNGAAGREHMSFSGLAVVAAPTEGLESLKAHLMAKVRQGSYDSQMLDHVHGTAFQGSSLANHLEGTVDSIPGITYQDLASLVDKVKGQDICVVGTGSGTHDQLVEQVHKVLGEIPTGGASKQLSTSVASKAVFVGSDVRIRYDSHKTATVALGFEGASWTDPKAMPLALMTTLLGSYTTSSGLGKHVSPKMCQEVASNNLASSISAFHLSYSDTGLFGMVATAPDNMLDDLFWFVMPNFVRLAHGVSDQELARAKLLLKTQVLSHYDGNIVMAEEMARQIQTIGRVMPLAEALLRVEALTVEDVKAAAKDVIEDQDHALAAIGGIHELPDYNWIRRHSYMLRY